MNLWESKGIGETGKNASGFHPVKAAFWQQTLIHHAQEAIDYIYCNMFSDH